MGEKAQFDLGIVGRKIAPTGQLRAESFADFPAHFCPHGNILQIGVLARRAACCSDRLVEIAMDATGLGIDLFGKGVDIGGAELF